MCPSQYDLDQRCGLKPSVRTCMPHVGEALGALWAEALGALWAEALGANLHAVGEALGAVG
jgi:hypothetical protein